MYEEFYKLDRAPFDTTPDPTFFFMSDGHQEALAALVYGIDRRKGFISLIGEVGTGKTTVLRAYIESEHVKNTRIIYLFNPRVSYEDLLLMVLRELRVEIPEGETKRVDLLHRVLVNEYKNGHNVVLIVDEAQNIPPETLESMRMLSNLETSSEKLLQIVLSGQPELEDLLATSRLRQLRQRIAVKVKLDPLSREEASEYVRYRLRRAGGEDNVFTKDAINWVVRYTGGNPRSINVLCDNALITGYGYQQFPISTPIIKEIAKDFDIEQWNTKTNSASSDWLRRVAMVLAVVGLAGFAYLMGSNRDVWQGDGEKVAAVSTVNEGLGVVDKPRDGNDKPVQSVADSEADAAESTALAEETSLIQVNVVEKANAEAKPVFESVVKTLDPSDDNSEPAANAASEGLEPEVAESAPMAELAESDDAEAEEASAIALTENEPTLDPQLDQSGSATGAGVSAERVARLSSDETSESVAPARSVTSQEINDAEPVSEDSPVEEQTVVVIDGVEQTISASELNQATATANETDAAETLVADANLTEATSVGAVQQATRIVQSGDSLWDMAAEVYGRVDETIVSRIIETNPELADPDSIYIGQRIVFPEL